MGCMSLPTQWKLNGKNKNKILWSVEFRHGPRWWDTCHFQSQLNGRNQSYGPMQPQGKQETPAYMCLERKEEWIESSSLMTTTVLLESVSFNQWNVSFPLTVTIFPSPGYLDPVGCNFVSQRGLSVSLSQLLVCWQVNSLTSPGRLLSTIKWTVGLGDLQETCQMKNFMTSFKGKINLSSLIILHWPGR